ncbi:MAG: Thiol-disulfide oxidoreductase ResA [Actinomycetota bacterium]|jgi:thiol-disulfide isomerase/thioredoxin
MRGLAVVAVSAVLLTGCGSAATSPVTIETSSNSMAEVVGVTIIPADEREQSIVISGETADGSELSTSTYAGDIVVVNAWASWCPPCIEELPLLATAADSYEGKGVTFLGLNSMDDPIAAASLLGSSVYPSIDDRDGAILATIPGVPPRSLPSTVILDRQGRIAVRIIGPVRPGQLEGAFERLLSEPA